MMLKNVSVRGEEFLLRSEDGKTWFGSAKELLEYRRRRDRERVKLRDDFIFAVDHGWNRIQAERRAHAKQPRESHEARNSISEQSADELLDIPARRWEVIAEMCCEQEAAGV